MAPKRQRSASVGPDAAASISAASDSYAIRFLVHGSGIVKQQYQLTAPATVADLSNAIIANPGKFKGEFSVERGVRIFTIQEEQLSTDYVFYTSDHELKIRLPPRPAQKREPAAQKAKKMEKKETINPTQAFFDWSAFTGAGPRLFLEYSNVKYAREGFVNQASNFLEDIIGMLKKKKEEANKAREAAIALASVWDNDEEEEEPDEEEELLRVEKEPEDNPLDESDVVPFKAKTNKNKTKGENKASEDELEEHVGKKN